MVANNVWVGSQYDYERDVRIRAGWYVVHACKEPYHRLFVGYETKGCPQDSPEYLVAIRGRRCALNIIDANDPKYIPYDLVMQALDIIEQWSRHAPTLIHCNMGRSRSATLAMLHLGRIGRLPKDFISAELEFIKMYKEYRPSTGMRAFAKEHWEQITAAEG